MFSRNKGNNFFLGNCLENAYVSGQIAILAGHCPVTGRYFEPCTLVIQVCNAGIWLQFTQDIHVVSFSLITIEAFRRYFLLSYETVKKRSSGKYEDHK